MSDQQQKIQKLQAIIDDSNDIVFFGGAGVSTESGIPDFRSAGGLFSQPSDYPPEYMVSRSFYDKHTEEFFDFYRANLVHLDARPNAAHNKLVELEKAGKLNAVITQNVDGLHQVAGSENVLELHGGIRTNICRKCGKEYDVDFIVNSTGVPRCDDCDGEVKPDVVLYEEALDRSVIEEAVRQISRADLLLIGGTSLLVYPAAGLVNYFNGKNIVVINKDATAREAKNAMTITGSIGDVLGAITVN